MFQSVYQVWNILIYCDLYAFSAFLLCGMHEWVVTSVAAFLFYEPDKVPIRFRDLNADHQRMLDCLKASGLKWVAVLPPHLTGNIQILHIIQIHIKSL
jgi:hypothetical protein